MTWSARFAYAVLALALGTAACGDADTADPAAAAEVLAAVEAVPDASPLQAVFGFAERGQDPLVEAERRFFEEVQLCMRGLGFDYLSPDLKQASVSIATDGLSNQEFAEQFGFGQITRLDRRLAELAAPPGQDPNDAITAAMASAELDAWNVALFGTQYDIDRDSGELIDPETGDNVDLSEVPASEKGCEGLAHERAFGARVELLADLSDELDDLENRIAADPKVVGLTQDWKQCMSGQGFDFARPQVMHDDVDGRVNDFLTNRLGIDFSAHPSTWEQAPPSTAALSVEDRAALAEAERYEIDVALASLQCSDAYDAGYADVRDTYELEFVSTHAGAISAATS